MQFNVNITLRKWEIERFKKYQQENNFIIVMLEL